MTITTTTGAERGVLFDASLSLPSCRIHVLAGNGWHRCGRSSAVMAHMTAHPDHGPAVTVPLCAEHVEVIGTGNVWCCDGHAEPVTLRGVS